MNPRTELSLDAKHWREKLAKSLFPVIEAPISVGESPLASKKFKAIIRAHDHLHEEPFSVVTDSYRLIRHEDAMDLGYEAFERIFGSRLAATLEVFNVITSRSGASFLADITSEHLCFDIGVPSLLNDGFRSSEPHLLFLRITNSYDRTWAVSIETGLCRWICRNGIIFGQKSIKFRDPHHQTKHQLMTSIAKKADSVDTDEIRRQVGASYLQDLDLAFGVAQGMMQTLRLSIPPVAHNRKNAGSWRDRCQDLKAIASKYFEQFGPTVFSALQGSSEWARKRSDQSPIQLDSYERRCGEMLQVVQTTGRWPRPTVNRDEQSEQMSRLAKRAAA